MPTEPRELMVRALLNNHRLDKPWAEHLVECQLAALAAEGIVICRKAVTGYDAYHDRPMGFLVPVAKHSPEETSDG